MTHAMPDPTEETGTTAGHAAFLGLVSSALSALLAATRAKVNAVVLGPAGVGLAAEINQLTSLAFVPVNILNGAALVSTTAEASVRGDKASIESARQSAIVCIALSSMVAVFVSTLAGRWVISGYGPSVRLLVFLSGAGLTFTSLATVANGLLTGAGKLGKLTLLAIINLCVTTALIVAGTLLLGLAGQFFAVAIGAIVTVPISLTIARRALALPPLRLSLRVDMRFLRKAITLGVTTLVGGLAMQSTLSTIRVVLDRHGGPAENGQFQAAYMLGMLYFSVIASSLGNYAFPRFAAAQTNDVLALEIASTARFVERLAPPLLIAGIAMRDVLIRMFYSRAFDPAIDALGFMTAADITKALSWTFAGPLLYRGRVGGYLVTEIVAAVGFGLGSVAAVPHFGLMGVAYAYFGSCCINVFVAAWVLSRTFRIAMPWRFILGALGWSGVAVCVQHFVTGRQPIRILVLLGCTIQLYRAGFISGLLTRLQAASRRLRTRA